MPAAPASTARGDPGGVPPISERWFANNVMTQVGGQSHGRPVILEVAACPIGYPVALDVCEK